MFECREDDVLKELIELLKLEKIEENIFRGQSQDLGFGNVYGGQVLGQALSAAYQTVPAERGVHSLHAYFLRPGDAKKPIVYNVDCIRDGKSFTTRSVIAIQNGRAILNMAASFQVAESGFDHQDIAPQPAGPEGITSERELAMKVADQIPESIREKILCRKAIEIRPVDPINPFAPEKRKPLRYAWFKAVGRLPDDPMIHQYMLAYASDFGLAVTSL
jgi:acyl-CoA thioesterase-2